MNYPESILIVEDEIHIRLMLKKLFRDMGIENILEAGDGLEGCKLYGKQPTDLVVMDINMPRMNGVDALKKITSVDPDAIVVMLTSLGTREAVEASAESGAYYYIRKDTPLSEMKSKFSGLFEEIFNEDPA